MRLTDKAALVTGAGGGLGTAIATRLAAEGASVLCADRDLSTEVDFQPFPTRRVIAGVVDGAQVAVDGGT